MAWHGLSGINAKQYRCGHCGYNVADNKGYFRDNDANQRVYICPNCDRPSYFDEEGRQYPGVVPGNEIEHLPKEVSDLYREARQCCSVSAYTASVLASRKILMNIAVNQGADEGKTFMAYIEYLADNNFIPPNGKGWVDHIRKKGNEATHEIAVMTQDDAEELIAFAEMLLKFIYEFPNRVPSNP